MPLRNSTNVPLHSSVHVRSRIRVHKAFLPLDGNVEISKVAQDEVHEGLVLIFTEELDERLGWELFAQLVSREAVLPERVVEFSEY